MANNIENRVNRLEDRIGINQKAECLEDMIAKFDRREYGQVTVMSIVAGAMSAKDQGQYFESLRQRLPGPLVDLFRDSIGKIQAATNAG